MPTLAPEFREDYTNYRPKYFSVSQLDELFKPLFAITDPGWLGVIIVVAVGALLIGMVMMFRSRTQ